jgi:hypothetical protein
MTNRVSIGWVARHKKARHFGGHRARCKVYDGFKRALSCQRSFVPVTPVNPERPWDLRPETDEEVLAKWDIVEVFAEFPECAS